MINLNDLNDKQREAVLYNDSPLLIIAGAGSGKTKTITYKIAYLVENGVNPDNILAITFTNKAAKEMKDRAQKLLNIQQGIQISTFHKFCGLFLRQFIDYKGYNKNFTIYDTDDCAKIIRKIIKEKQIDPKTEDLKKLVKPNALLNIISFIKNIEMAPEQYITAHYEGEAGNIIKTVYNEYSRILKDSNSVDFDDMILLTVHILEEQEYVRNITRAKYQYIFVDEYQDTNNLQFRLIKLITGNNPHLTVVGDEDQSIYKFRGADISNIKDFKKTFTNSNIIKLEQNYRSTSHILNAANTVIKNNKNRVDKNLWTARGEGEKVEVYTGYNDLDEAKYVVDKIQELNDYKNTVILYRSNYLSRRYEDELRKHKIPYRIKDGLSFYSREEVKDVVSYLKLLVNPADIESFSRIVNIPKRGIGGATIKKVIDYAKANNKTPIEALGELENMGLTKNALSSMIQFRDVLKGLIIIPKIEDMIKYLLDSFYGAYLSSKYDKEDMEITKTKVQNLQELMNVAVTYVEGYIEINNLTEDEKIVIRNNSGNTILDDFLNDLSLSSPDDNEDDNIDKVELMSVHSAKGLEYKNVFLVSFNDFVFPSVHAIESEDPTDLEEERRLAYVAITRAKDNLYISNYNAGYQFGQQAYYYPSRFLKEINKEDLVSNISSTVKKSNIFNTPSQNKSLIWNNPYKSKI